MKFSCYFIIFVATVATAYLLLGLSQASAETIYSWIDHGGHLNFGANPPANAQEVKEVKKEIISRYSSDKVIRNYKRKALAATKELAVSSPTAKARLEQGKLSVTHNQNNFVTSCKVLVRNLGGEIANNIMVTFEFEDGTMVPGSGPKAIAAKADATYYITPDKLPIIVKTGQNDKAKGLSYSKRPKPKVLIQSSPT